MTSSWYSHVDKQRTTPVLRMQKEGPRIVSFELFRFSLTLPSLKCNPPTQFAQNSSALLCPQSCTGTALCTATHRHCAVHCHTPAREGPDYCPTTTDYEQVERCRCDPAATVGKRPCCRTCAHCWLSLGKETAGRDRRSWTTRHWEHSPLGIT